MSQADETDEQVEGGAREREEALRETTEMSGVMTDTTELLRTCELFGDLTPEELREIVQVSEYMALEPGECLFEQGESAEAMFVVADGRLQVRSRTPVGEEVVLAELEAGAIVGEMSIIGGGERSASVEALEEANLFRLARDSFEALRAQNRPAAYKLILRLARMLGDRRRNTDARIQEVFEDPAEHLEDFETQVHEMLGQIRKA